MLTPERIVVAYSVAMPLKGRRHELAAEAAVAGAAGEAADALSIGRRRPALLAVKDDLREVCRQLQRRRPRVLVNLCEGFAGNPAREADMAGVWELLGIPFTGNSSAALRLCQDKFRAKLLLRGAGVMTPEGWLADHAGDIPARASWPLIVKPSLEDGGIGLDDGAVVKNREDLARRIRLVKMRYRQPALVEQYIEGREVSVAVIEHDGLTILPPSEIVFQDWPADVPRIVGYAAKWRPRHPYCLKTVPQCPAHLSKSILQHLRQTVLTAWRVAGLRGYARFDFRMDQHGRIYLLELNPNPAASRDSGLARALAVAGIAYADFWKAQVRNALKQMGEAA